MPAEQAATPTKSKSKSSRRDLQFTIRQADNGYIVEANDYTSFKIKEKKHVATDIDDAFAWIKKQL